MKRARKGTSLKKHTGGHPFLRAVISGGGPVGLLLAIMLKETLNDKIRVSVFEGRWKKVGGRICWKNREDGNTRRTQVITLQSKPLCLLPLPLRKSLLPDGGFSEVWPYSKDSPVEVGRPKNLRIMDIENRLLRYAQNLEIQLVPEKFHPAQTPASNYDILAICEGRHSRTRQYYQDKFGAADPSPYSLRGKHLEDVVLSLQVRSGLKPAEAVVLTILQRRFLLNMNDDGYGHLNVRLCHEEAQELKESYDISTTALWPRILEGLKLFDILPEDLIAINCFNISMKHRSRFSAILDWNSPDQPTYGFLLGDAANAIHLWPGRGLNQGFVGAISLVWCLQERLRNGHILREADYSKHEAVMHMLQHRHNSRAWGAMIRRAGGPPIPISERIGESIKSPVTDRELLLEHLSGHFNEISSRINRRLPDIPDWEPIKKRLKTADIETLHTLVASGPWETFWSGGPEVDLGVFYPECAVEGAVVC